MSATCSAPLWCDVMGHGCLCPIITTCKIVTFPFNHLIQEDSTCSALHDSWKFCAPLGLA